MDVSAALPAQLMQSRVRQALTRGATVLTANQRAARTLRRAFDLHQRELGLASWQPPPILAWETWLGSLWHRLLVDGHASELLLSPTQEHRVWRNIIAAEIAAASATASATDSLRPVDALAETAASAWSLLHDYRARHRLAAAADTSDTRAFVRWARAFERVCRDRGYLTQAELAEALRAAVAAGKISLPRELLLVGFDSKRPAQIALLDAVGGTGTQIDDLQPESARAASTIVRASNAYDELTACARRLRDRLTEQPEAALAVIVPAIDDERAEIDRVFRQLLAPEANDIAAPVGLLPYEFSLGVPLAHTPLVATALDILRWAAGPLPFDRVTALLLSPHFAPTVAESPSEHLHRAEFDAFVLRERQPLLPEISLDNFAQLVAGWRHASRLPALSRHLRALQAVMRRNASNAAERTHADWAATMHDLLEAAGWSAGSEDSSIEFQTRRKWESALDELATLDFEGNRVSFAAAFAALERIAAKTLFAPESRHAPIQIMGPLEAAGSAFDAIWFLRAGDLGWPAVPATNPLLPWRLQRDLAMPGADPARDFELAKRITARIAASAPGVDFSYARQTADGDQRPSPALAGVAIESPGSADLVAAPTDAEPILLECLPDDVPIPSPPGRALEGGAGILAAQAACGFRAFAEKRLYSSALEPASLGLDHRERGNLVHAVLDRFWAQVEGQAALRGMTTADRDDTLARSIDEALARYHADPGWPREYLDAERLRLLNLLRQWMDYEATERSPFVVKSREEQRKDVQIGPLRLNVRVDRVDTSLVDGGPAGEIILDYKTGLAKPADWLGDRPDAPQLPLYAVVSRSHPSQSGESPLPLAGIAFATVRPGTEMGVNGYEARDGVLPKAAKLPAESLDAQVDEWRATLTSLAEDFHSGHAAVAPKQYPATCQYCGQRLLCRLDPSALSAEVLAEPDPYLDPESDATDPDAAELEADFG